MKQPRDVIRPEVDCMEQADAIIEALGRAGYEIVQRFEVTPPTWWSLPGVAPVVPSEWVWREEGR